MKKTILERAAGKLNLPADVLAGLPKIEITGCREIFIENHSGILRYDTNEIVVSGGTVKFTIRGDDFILRAMTPRDLRISGLLFGIDLQY
ncbi:MAG: sporulation protein [Oscillospiraceae bacterium]|nr:sporulation protein [Oscillospiraceae bacterium]